ncbi:MAG: hypothetical protein HYZ42_01910 [Bacteroidetes bacterium]|nr:hypothetical protein [Bacteroidota bacterium]
MENDKLQSLTKDLRKIKQSMMDVEEGLKKLDPNSETFIYEYVQYEKRISLLSRSFSDLITYLQFINDKHGTIRKQLRRLIETNNRIHDKAQFLKPLYLQLSQSA